MGFGELLRGPLKSLNHTESGLNADLAHGRTPLWNNVTMVWSHIGNTEIVIGVCVVAVALLWWRTRQWWVAVVPAIAIALQATIFVIATAIIGRPRPEVPHLDPAPPTSSYPSGHVGRLDRALPVVRPARGPADRAAVAAPGGHRRLRSSSRSSWPTPGSTAACTTSRTSSSAPLNGIACALLAWTYLRTPPPQRGRHAAPRALNRRAGRASGGGQCRHG